MKRATILFVPLLFLIAIVAFLFWFKSVGSPASPDTSLKDFLIVRGASASQVGNNLFKEGLIKSPLAFKIYIQVTGKAKSIPAGEYRLSGSYSLFKLVDELTKGPTEIWVTIPEGLRREEIAEKFATSFGKGEEFRNEFIVESEGLEGYLFPDTYLFPKTASASSVVTKMRSTFDKKTADLQEKIDSGSLSLNQVVTLASIVEREAKFADERPIVAGILLNRLNIGMGLQVDATVQYAVASKSCGSSASCEWWPILTRDDLEIASSYNTYRFRGLPPAPIASPGLSSIKAAVEPEPSDYLYYLHDSKGQAHYAETLEEHNENIRKYLSK